jgi:hypothetical protein
MLPRRALTIAVRGFPCIFNSHMPHRTVLVVANDFDEALSPFQHNGSGDCPRENLVFVDREDALLDEYLNGGEDKWVTLANGDRLHGCHPSFLSNGTFRYPADATVTFNSPHKSRYASFDDFVREYDDLGARDPETGRYGHWINPNGKWTWYVLGGRWSGFFTLKAGAAGVLGPKNRKVGPQSGENELRADSCKAGDIDFDCAHRRTKTEAETLWAKAHAPNVSEVERKFAYGVMPDMTEEAYVSCAVAGVYGAHAVLMNGSWYEQGGSAWWGEGPVPATEKHWKRAVRQLLQELPPQTTVSLIDYHN